MSLPGMATGDWLPGDTASITTTVTSSLAVAPLLSVTVNLNTYVPTTRLLIIVTAELLLTIRDAVGPLTFDHAYLEIVPSGSLDAKPFKVTLLVGSAMVTSVPALATGG